jgi:hypothetical protein
MGIRASAAVRALALLAGGLCVETPTAALAAGSLAAASPRQVLDGVESYTLPRANLALTRKVVATGPGWVRERLAGVAGPLEFTDAADYFVVSDLEGIDAVPLGQVVGAEFATFVKARLREDAQKTASAAERVYVLQKSALAAAEPLFLDRDAILQDPYAYLDMTICVPMPVVGGISAPSFSPETVIREIAPGVLEYHEAFAGIASADPTSVTLGRQLGTVDLNVARAALPSGGMPTGAVAQSASTGGMSCFKLRDVLADGTGGSCKVDLLDPSSWYHEYKAKGTVDLDLPGAETEVVLDSTQGIGQTLLGSKYEGTLRYKAVDHFEEVDGRRLGGSLEVGVGALFCVPLWLRPVEGRLWAHVESRRELEMHGTLKYSATEAGEVTTKADGSPLLTSVDGGLPDPYTLAELTLPEPAFLYPIAFPVGPVPVLLILDAPVEIGAIAGVESPTLTNFEADGELSLGFDYSCRFGGACVAHQPFGAEARSGTAVTGDLGAEGRAFVKPYAGISLRASLYFPGAVYAKVGPRAYMNFDFWGASKPCGDADGDGHAEWVQALTLDHDLGIELIGEVGIYDITTGIGVLDSALDLVPAVPFPIGQPLQWHLGFMNLLDHDGKAFQPMLSVPADVKEDLPAVLGARMRPCYPYTDEVHYTLLFGDGKQGSAAGKPQQSVATTHTWSNSGTYTVQLTGVEDAHGRTFDLAFGPLETTVKRSLVVKSATLVKQVAPGGSTLTVRR